MGFSSLTAFKKWNYIYKVAPAIICAKHPPSLRVLDGHYRPVIASLRGDVHDGYKRLVFVVCGVNGILLNDYKLDSCSFVKIAYCPK